MSIDREVVIDGCELDVVSGRSSVVVIATSVMIIGGAVVVVRRASVAGEFSELDCSPVVVKTVSVVTVATDVDGGRVLLSNGGFVAVAAMIRDSEEVVSGIGGKVVVCSAIED